MKSWLIDDLKGIDGLRPGQAPEPTPGPGEVVLAVRLAALNPADAYLAAGQYPARPKFPHILGRDGVGDVVAVGDEVTGLHVGDRRAILRCEVGVDRPGTLAERVAVPAESLAAIPEGWTEEESAGAALVYLTALQALCQWKDGPPNDGVLLVTGASGGVGVASVQLGKALGFTVWALSRDAAKGEKLKALGADEVFNPIHSAWKHHAKTRRVDLAIDNVGGPGFMDVIDVMGKFGKISVVGRLAGPVPQFNTASLFFRRVRIGGVAVSDYTPAEAQTAWAIILQYLRRIDARPVVDQVFPFAQVPQAFDRLAAGPMGKVLIRVSRDDGG